ncbi:MAG: hypothetical protein ABI681_07270 [Gemmatimonadales bacterium]
MKTSIAGSIIAAVLLACTTAAKQPPVVEKWEVTPQGIGPVRAGMSIAEANTALNNALVVPARLEECDYVHPRNGPTGVFFMVEKGKISRGEVREGEVATREGARIGDTEDRIKSLYGSQVTVQPHKYTDGHYLVVTPKNPADSAYRIVFETDGKTVERYRSGKLPAVQYVEGCS